MAESSKRKFKVWKATRESPAGFMVTPESAVMAGSKDSFIAIGKSGTVLSGPFSHLGTSDQHRQAGLFVGMNDMIKMIPSTMMTATPDQRPDPPRGLTGAVANTMPYVLALVGTA